MVEGGNTSAAGYPDEWHSRPQSNGRLSRLVQSAAPGSSLSHIKSADFENTARPANQEAQPECERDRTRASASRHGIVGHDQACAAGGNDLGSSFG